MADAVDGAVVVVDVVVDEDGDREAETPNKEPKSTDDVDEDGEVLGPGIRT